MLRTAIAYALSFLILFSAASAQEIPPGVTYVHASDAANATAKSLLEQGLLKPGSPIASNASDSIVVGPMLWGQIVAAAKDGAIRDSPPLILVIDGPTPIVVEGRRMLTDTHRAAFWKALWEIYPQLKVAKVRKAKAPELSYFWSTISFDVAEPFFTIDTGSHCFIVNFIPTESSSGITWLDLVGDLRSLPKRPN